MGTATIYSDPDPITLGKETRDLVDTKFDQFTASADDMVDEIKTLIPDLVDATLVMAATEIIKAGLGDIVFATLTNPVSGVALPTPATHQELEDIDVDFSDITEPTYDPTGGAYTSSLMEANIAWLFDQMQNGSTGLNPAVEALIWDNEKERQRLENERLYRQVDVQESLGWSQPPAGYFAQLSEVNNQISRQNTLINNEIAIAQAKLAQENTHFVHELALKVDTFLGNYLIENGKAGVQIYTAQVEAMKALISARAEKVKALGMKNESIATVFKAEAEANSAIYKAITDAYDSDVKYETAKSEVLVKKAQIELDNATQIYGMHREAIKTWGMIFAQIAAANLSRMSVAAQLGYHEQRSDTTSKSHDLRESQSYDVNIIHNYSHSG